MHIDVSTTTVFCYFEVETQVFSNICALHGTTNLVCISKLASFNINLWLTYRYSWIPPSIGIYGSWRYMLLHTYTFRKFMAKQKLPFSQKYFRNAKRPENVLHVSNDSLSEILQNKNITQKKHTHTFAHCMLQT